MSSVVINAAPPPRETTRLLNNNNHHRPLGAASTINGPYTYRPTPAPSAAQLAAAAAIVGRSLPAHMSNAKDDTDGYEISDSEMEDSVVLKDGRRFPTA